MYNCRKDNPERIISKEGYQLRMNLSIQTESSFGNIKQDIGFSRFLSRWKQNVTAESILLAMAYNINKLYIKIQSDRIEWEVIPLLWKLLSDFWNFKKVRSTVFLADQYQGLQGILPILYALLIPCFGSWPINESSCHPLIILIIIILCILRYRFDERPASAL